jgi:succinate dehydrogenase / fumarate reductase, membrane anchor subunit
VGVSRFGAADAVRNPSRSAHMRPVGSGFETWMWYFMRLSGLALVLLALGHMFIMHVLTALGGQELSFAFVTARWGSPFWRGYDLVLLLLAMTHGLNGARIIIGDYSSRGGARGFLLTLLYGLGAIWIVLGIFVILTFDPNGAPAIGPFS